jgi:phosphoribosylformylglycinamidine synthase
MLETEIKVTPELVAEHGLTSDEYARIRRILRREPNLTELGIFSVMWSEHCSYKSSRVHLKRLPTRAPQVLQGPGENAGAVDVGDGLAAVFKMESHNHPSYVEPFQGAATGVGGILRDIFTMGARPIAVMDSLRFGLITPPATPVATPVAEQPHIVANGAPLHPAQNDSPEIIARNRRLLDGVVRGIAFYGNCFGVPTVGGEVAFEPGYAGNPLVNVLALGIAPKDDLFLARASGAGNPVIYVGAKTGRDGIHGASLLASAEFTEESKQKRPNVQVGDPFLEKLLLEACLEAMATGAIVGIQDMGAAGLTSTSCEMASRGGVGIELELARVPQRETGMTPYEMMLSESQERMLLVAERGREQDVFAVFRKWGLDAVEIGQVTSDGLLRLFHHGRLAAEIPAAELAEEAPVYHRPIVPPILPPIGAALPTSADTAVLALRAKLAGSSPNTISAADTKDFGAPRDPSANWTEGPAENLTHNFRRLLAAPNIASKRSIFEQYDHMVLTNTVVLPGAADAAVVRLKGTPRALALSTDGNGRWCALNPYIGAMHAVAEAARNVASVGARPCAATNCLNFGNPEKPEVMWQFSRAVDGIAEACRALAIPITGGNVSFYNDTLGKSIDPTPVLGVLGVLEDASHSVAVGFRSEGDLILLLDGRGRGGPAKRGPGDQADRGLADNYISGNLGTSAGGGSSSANAGNFDLSVNLANAATPASDETTSLREFLSSEYARTILFNGHIPEDALSAAIPPAIDLAAEARLIETLVALATQRLVASAHDLSDGGLAVALAECAIASDGLGADADLESAGPAALSLFCETGARALVTTAESSLADVLRNAAKCGVAAHVLGRVTRGDFHLRHNGVTVIRDTIGGLHSIWSGALEIAVLGSAARELSISGESASNP